MHGNKFYTFEKIMQFKWNLIRRIKKSNVPSFKWQCLENQIMLLAALFLYNHGNMTIPLVFSSDNHGFEIDIGYIGWVAKEA